MKKRQKKPRIEKRMSGHLNQTSFVSAAAKAIGLLLVSPPFALKEMDASVFNGLELEPVLRD